MNSLFYIFLLIIFSFFIEWLRRKIFARIQLRYGPHFTGFHGLLQPFADFIKLFQKESFHLSRFTPFVVFSMLALSLFSLMFLPVAGKSYTFPGDFIVIIILFDLWVFSKMSLGFLGGVFEIYGGFRSFLLFLSYEVPFIFAIASFFIHSNTLSFAGLSFSPVLLIPLIPLLISATAKMMLQPFEIPNAEQELISGVLTDLSGGELALTKLAENLEILFVGALASTLIFGILDILWLLVSTFIIISVVIFLSALYPRFRIDQALGFSWKFLIPLSILGVILCSL